MAKSDAQTRVGASALIDRSIVRPPDRMRCVPVDRSSRAQRCIDQRAVAPADIYHHARACDQPADLACSKLCRQGRQKIDGPRSADAGWKTSRSPFQSRFSDPARLKWAESLNRDWNGRLRAGSDRRG
jgi:hypothetical protein